VSEFDWVGCWRSYATAYHWTPAGIMDGFSFEQFYRFAFGQQKTTLTKAGEAAMADLRDQINRRRAAKGLPPMKPAN
jgi:hypothetical protein